MTVSAQLLRNRWAEWFAIVADRLVDNIAISICGTDMQKSARSIFMFGFVGISTGYIFPRSKFKVMVKLICDISTIVGEIET
jgi:hypothetical protein